ncbi:unnamed protein product, partial [marine sediment metagenome]
MAFAFTKEDIPQFRKWQRDLLGCAEFFWPDVRFSNQQRGFLEELNKIVSAKLKVGDLKDKLEAKVKKSGLKGDDIDNAVEKQLPAILDKKLDKEEKKYYRKIGVSVQSCNGSGKDFIAACITILFTLLYPNAKNSCTANTGQQLKVVLWAEISKLLRLSRKAQPDDKLTILQQLLELQSTKLFLREAQGKEWFTEAVTVNTSLGDEEQAESIAGRHEDYQVWVVDEGSNIGVPVFQKIERTLT